MTLDDVTRKELLESRFQELDQDQSGDLDADELVEVLMKECALRISQARALVEDFDLDQNGRIDKAEFNNMWMKLFG